MRDTHLSINRLDRGSPEPEPIFETVTMQPSNTIKMEKILEKFQNFGGLSTKDKVVVGGSLGMPPSTTHSYTRV